MSLCANNIIFLTHITHMRNVRNEPYAFVAYDWHQEEAHA